MPDQLDIGFDRRRGHAARIENSPRLRLVLSILADGAWHGTLDIVTRTSLCAVGSAISELRANGYQVECRAAGRGRYEYRLVKGDL